MNDNLTNVINRVQKLLSLTHSSNANEAANAAAVANRLIDTYRLSEADLEIKTESSEPIEEDVDYIYQSGRVNPWKTYLISILVDHYGLVHWNDAEWSTGRKVSRYRLVGRKSDIVIAKYMFTWLMAECQRLADLNVKGMGRVVVGSYCSGFVHGIALQLKNSRIEVRRNASNSAICKINIRNQEAESFLYKLRPNLKNSYSRSQMRFDSNAYTAGKNKGESFHLGSSLEVAGKKLLNC